MAHLHLRKWQMSRRTVLRGLGATISLPRCSTRWPRQLRRPRNQAERVSLHSQRREHADLADSKGGQRLRVDRATRFARETSRRHDADQRPASPDGHRQTSQLRACVAHRRQCAGRWRRVPQHRLGRSVDRRGARDVDPFSVTGTRDRRDVAGVVARWHSTPRRTQHAADFQRALRRGEGQQRDHSPPSQPSRQYFGWRVGRCPSA